MPYHSRSTLSLVNITTRPPASASRPVSQHANPLRLLRLALVLCVLILQACAAAPPKPPPQSAADSATLEAAKVDFAAGNYSKVVELLTPLAAEGNPAAEYALGYMYYYGYGVPKDRDTAWKLMDHAAVQGYKKAQDAQLLRSGTGHHPPAQSPAAPQNGTNKSNGQSGTSPGGVPDQPQAPAPVPTPPVQGNMTKPPPASKNTQAPVPEQAAQTAAVAANTAPAPVTANTPKPPPASQHSSAPSPTPPASSRHTAPAPAASATIEQKNAQAKPSQSSPSSINGVAWILARPPGHFTIQLVSTHSESEARDYLHRHRLAGDAAYYHFRRDADSWYSVIYGDYPTHEEAQSALSKLDPKLRAAAPWIRPFARVQQLIRQTKAVKAVPHTATTESQPGAAAAPVPNAPAKASQPAPAAAPLPNTSVKQSQPAPAAAPGANTPVNPSRPAPAAAPASNTPANPSQPTPNAAPVPSASSKESQQQPNAAPASNAPLLLP